MSTLKTMGGDFMMGIGFHGITTDVVEALAKSDASYGRTSKYTDVELHEKASKAIAAQFLRHLVVTVPDRIHTVLTDNGIEFTHQAWHKYAVGHTFINADNFARRLKTLKGLTPYEFICQLWT